ncbi:hypothetical protein PPS11_21469 [Pseudomonas putida S11]|nr:hypothetical protein PPS11_21469 [Pseudomonas putida S11]
MEHLTTLKTLHIIATALLLLGALGLALWTVRARRQGDAEAYAKLLRRPLVFVWLVMGLCLVSMPFTGWWLVHLGGLAAGADLGAGVQRHLYAGRVCRVVAAGAVEPAAQGRGGGVALYPGTGGVQWGLLPVHRRADGGQAGLTA